MALLLAAGFAALSISTPWAEPDPAPDYSARVLGGDQEAALAGLRGKVVLLNTWATWCAPCRGEMPDFEIIYQRYRTRGLAVVGVNIDEGSVDEKVQRFVEKMGVSFEIWRDPRNRFAKRFRVLGVPETLLVDREGAIMHRWSGPMDPSAAENLEMIEKALRPGAPVAARPEPEAKAALQRGRRLAEQRGCLTCHSTDGSPGMGPTWKGLPGAEVTLADGRRIVRDSAYLKRAILDPDIEIVAGYANGVMSGAIPGKRLTEPEVDALVRYLESLN
jgi:cytochrome c-type biogenesis protein